MYDSCYGHLHKHTCTCGHTHTKPSTKVSSSEYSNSLNISICFFFFSTLFQALNILSLLFMLFIHMLLGYSLLFMLFIHTPIHPPHCFLKWIPNISGIKLQFLCMTYNALRNLVLAYLYNTPTSTPNHPIFRSFQTVVHRICCRCSSQAQFP